MASGGVVVSATMDHELEKMMEELGLREEDLDDVICEEEVPARDQAVQWMALARVHKDGE